MIQLHFKVLVMYVFFITNKDESNSNTLFDSQNISLKCVLDTP